MLDGSKSIGVDQIPPKLVSLASDNLAVPLTKAGSPLGGKMSRRKNFRQSNWLIELSPRKNVEPRIVGIRSIFAARHFFA